MRLYADPGALAAYPGGSNVPAGDVDSLLRTGSRVVDQLLRGVVYDVDTEGLPTDTDVAEAMSDAVCAIAVECHALGTLTAGSTQQWESVGIGNVSLSTLQGPSATDTLTVAGVPVPAAALIALSAVGTVQVVVR